MQGTNQEGTMPIPTITTPTVNDAISFQHHIPSINYLTTDHKHLLTQNHHQGITGLENIFLHCDWSGIAASPFAIINHSTFNQDHITSIVDICGGFNIYDAFDDC